MRPCRNTNNLVVLDRLLPGKCLAPRNREIELALELGGGCWVHSREASGPGHSWCLTSAHLLRQEEGHLCSTGPGSSHGKRRLQRPRWKIRKGGKGWREGAREGTKLWKELASSLSSSWSAWPAGKSFRITSHNLIMTLFHPLGVNKAFPSWTEWPGILGRTFPGPAQGFPLPKL